MRRTRLRPLAVFCLIAAVAAAQIAVQDPAAPPGGFAVTTLFDQALTLDDGAVTALDVQYPDPSLHPPPAAGWPLVVFCHGLNGSRLDYRSGFAADFARAGFCTACYDLRGHGLFAADPANAGKRSDFAGVRDRRDLKFVIEAALAAYPALTDDARVGVFGFSLGGGLSWSAAAWSGRICDDSDPGFGLFPNIKAVVALAWNPATGDALAPGKLALSRRLAALLLGGPSLLDPAYYAALEAASDAEDFGSIYGLSQDDRSVLALLPTTTTAIFHGHSFGDLLFAPSGAAAAMALLPPSTPRRLFISAIGDHGSQVKLEESAVGVARIHAWFDSRLKGRDVAGDSGPPVEWSVESADYATAADPFSAPARRVSDAWPPTEAQPWRLHLTGAGAVAVAPPTGVEPSRVLTQNAPTTPLDAVGLRGAGFSQVPLLASLPPGELIYTALPLANPLEFAGSFRAEINVAPADGDWQVCVAFGVLTPAGFRCLSTAAIVERGGSPAVQGQRVVESDPFAAAVPAGAILQFRIRTQNLQDRDPGAPGELRIVPVLQAFSCGIGHGVATPSFVDLPVLAVPRIGAALFVDRSAVSLSAPDDVRFTVHMGADGANGAGGDALIGLSLGGWQPGTYLGSLTLPLNIDPLLEYMYAGFDTWPFQGFVGPPDFRGRRTGTYLVGSAWIPPIFAGVTFHAASILLDQGAVKAVSNPVALMLLP